MREQKIDSSEEIDRKMKQLDPEKLIFMPPSDSSDYLDSLDDAWEKRVREANERRRKGEK